MSNYLRIFIALLIQFNLMNNYAHAVYEKDQLLDAAYLFNLLETISEEEIVELKKDIENYWIEFQRQLYSAIATVMTQAMKQKNNTIFTHCLYITHDIKSECRTSLQENFELYIYNSTPNESTDFLLSNKIMFHAVKNTIIKENELCLNAPKPQTYLDALIKGGAQEHVIRLVYSFGIGAQTPRGQQWIREHYAPNSNNS